MIYRPGVKEVGQIFPEVMIFPEGEGKYFAETREHFICVYSVFIFRNTGNFFVAIFLLYH